MQNRFPKPCTFCRQIVPAGEGRLWRWSGRWFAAHTGCSSETRRDPVKVERARADLARSAKAWRESFHRADLGDELGAALAADRALAAEGRLSVIRNGHGDVIATRNPAGLCEDAPCCGCCS